MNEVTSVHTGLDVMNEVTSVHTGLDVMNDVTCTSGLSVPLSECKYVRTCFFFRSSLLDATARS